MDPQKKYTCLKCTLTHGDREDAALCCALIAEAWYCGKCGKQYGEYDIAGARQCCQPMPFPPRLKALAHIEKIYLEHVQALFHTTAITAAEMCDVGVKTGALIRHVEVIHPQDGSVIATAESEDKLPAHVTACVKMDGEMESPLFSVGALEKRTYYTRAEKTA